METKGAALLLLGFYACSTLSVCRGYNFTVFRREIDPNCLSKLWSPLNPAGEIRVSDLSLENFISLVEKLEVKNPAWNLYQVTRVLLRRFSFEGMEFAYRNGQRMAAQSTEYRHRWQIVKELVADDETAPDSFREFDLDQTEKCTLFFMLGHQVNRTFRSGLDVPAAFNVQPMSSPLKLPPAARYQSADHPREQGVVSFGGDNFQTIAMGKVLNGIASGQLLRDLAVTSTFDIRSTEFPKNRRINTLVGATFGDVTSLAAIYQDHESQTVDEYFGPAGEWVTYENTSEYRLSRYQPGSTQALFRGAVDGFQIGDALKRLRTTEQLPLSQVLRDYYSGPGILLSPASDTMGASHCRRQSAFQGAVGPNAIRESMTSFYLLHFFKQFGQVIVRPEFVMSRAYETAKLFLRMMDDRAPEGCNMTKLCQTETSSGLTWDDYCKGLDSACQVLDWKVSCDCGPGRVMKDEKCAAEFTCEDKKLGEITWRTFCKALGGSCQDTRAGPTCQCQPGKAFLDDKCMDPCLSEVTPGGLPWLTHCTVLQAKCKVGVVLQPYCECPEGKEMVGDACQTKDPCGALHEPSGVTWRDLCVVRGGTCMVDGWKPTCFCGHDKVFFKDDCQVPCLTDRTGSEMWLVYCGNLGAKCESLGTVASCRCLNGHRFTGTHC